MISIITLLKSDKSRNLVQKLYRICLEVDHATHFEFIYADNFMDVKILIELTCLAVSVFIKGKSTKDISNMFGISKTLVLMRKHN